MFSVLETPTPLHYRSSAFAQTMKNSTFEDISFSSYLKPKDPSSSQNDDTEISIFDAQKYFCENNDPKYIKTQQKQEPSSHDILSVPRMSSVSSVDGYGRNYRTRSFHATPTASSEASWNSQTGLLANPPGSVGVSLKNFHSDSDSKKRSSVAKKWIFGRKCCCTGKKSVEVKKVTTSSESDNLGPVIANESNNNAAKSNYLYAKRDSQKAKALSVTSDVMEIHQQKILAPNPLILSPPENNFPAPRQQRISASGRSFVDGTGGFSFPILNTSTQGIIKPAMKGIIAKTMINNPVEDPPRDSLEVFQPMDIINARPHYDPGSPIARTDEDMGSDASSDLFEIESFSTQTTSYPMYRRRDSLDEAPTFNARRFASANGINLNNNNNIQYGRRSLDEPPTPSVAATECYAPSEVSIDWSVTTAEGFDRASVSNFSVSASEIGGAAFFRQRVQEESGGDGGKRKGNGGLLLMSCRQEKAVSVGPQPVKCFGPAGEGPPVFPLHVGGRPPRANKPPLGSDHSARLSLAFAA
ncbi:hypothetical protein DH2020_029253 [Rehmannia glutinosa]|uniref:Uncharacterized protein n=1 Tax=Rehmannia glutinosa TaxID=99300 RepID=A0ABR0VQ07_REHGL